MILAILRPARAGRQDPVETESASNFPNFAIASAVRASIFPGSTEKSSNLKKS
jgi:hypothetical protein